MTLRSTSSLGEVDPLISRPVILRYVGMLRFVARTAGVLVVAVVTVLAMAWRPRTVLLLLCLVIVLAALAAALPHGLDGPDEPARSPGRD